MCRSEGVLCIVVVWRRLTIRPTSRHQGLRVQSPCPHSLPTARPSAVTCRTGEPLVLNLRGERRGGREGASESVHVIHVVCKAISVSTHRPPPPTHTLRQILRAYFQNAINLQRIPLLLQVMKSHMCGY